MSDVQIITGISILVSGLAQLQCGISCYHWQVLFQLAWFSSLTHLSCLTLLQTRLYNRPSERVWRIFSMLLLVVFLVICLMPTANNYWSYSDASHSLPGLPSIRDYAICDFKPVAVDVTGAFGSMISSVSLLVIGFIIRIIKVHRSLSVLVNEQRRRKMSQLLRSDLRKIYTGSNSDGPPQARLMYSLVYRPLLAAFLALRILADIWSSVFSEASLFPTRLSPL